MRNRRFGSWPRLNFEPLDARINPDGLPPDCEFPPPDGPNVYVPSDPPGPMPLDPGVPAYASLPASNFTVYLDFNGHTTTNTYFNSFYNKTTIVTPSFDIDGNGLDFSVEEQNRIRDVWRQVSEDFSPFDVNVTTIEPADIHDLVKLGAGDTRWGIRVSIGGTNTGVLGITGAGGIAYTGSFNYASDTPAFAFADTLFDDVKIMTDAVSHEVGHTMGLSHDGLSSPVTEYYTGHGSGATSWAPIMGVGYTKTVVQWSKGEYSNPSNTEDDLTKITTLNGFTYRADDHGDTNAAATNLAGTTAVTSSGVITTTTDRDVFRFVATGGGSYTFTLNPYIASPNLDIRAELYNSSGGLVTTSNPAATLSAGFSQSLAAGTYFLHLLGTGVGTGSTGYTTYASLGQYTLAIAGSFGDALTNAVSGTVYEDWNGNALRDAGDPALPNVTVFSDTNASGAFDSGEPSAVTKADGSYTLGVLASGSHVLRIMPGSGYSVTAPADGKQSVTTPTAGGFSGRDFGLVRTAAATFGRAYHDQNVNGSPDPAEPGLAGRTVFLDANGNGNFDVGTTTTVAASAGLPMAIPDTATFKTTTLAVSGVAGTITDVNVTVNIAHTAVGQMFFYLRSPSPSFTYVYLHNRAGGTGDNISNTVFDDESINPSAMGLAPFAGSFAPPEALSKFDGQSANGTWEFGIFDETAGETGSLLAWSITFTTGSIETSAATDSLGNYRFPVSAGNHNVRILPGAGWSGVVPANNLNATTVATVPVLNRNFGLTNQTYALPAVATTAVNGGTIQRSRVTSLAVSFNSPVTLAANAFSLRRLSDNLTLPAGQLAVSTALLGGVTVATLTFSGTGAIENGSLADGVWELKVDRTKVTNSTGGMAADYLSPTTGPNRVYRLFGDINGDGTVEGATDFAQFGGVFGVTLAGSPFDVNGDSTIDGPNDFAAFGGRFGVTL